MGNEERTKAKGRKLPERSSKGTETISAYEKKKNVPTEMKSLTTEIIFEGADTISVGAEMISVPTEIKSAPTEIISEDAEMANEGLETKPGR